MIEVRVPDLGESIESAQVARVLVNEGDTIEVEQAIVELESDKAAMEMPSPEAGTVAEILVKQGDEVEPGQVILKLSDGGEHAARKTGTGKQAEQAEDEEEAEQAEDEEEAEEAEDEEEAEEAEDEGEAEEAEGEEEAEQAEVAEQAGEPERAATEPAEPRSEPGPERAAAPAAGPATRRLARELGVRVEDVTPSGRGGRVTREDVKAFVRERGKSAAHAGQQAAAQAARAPAVELPDFSRWGEIERMRMSRLERTGAARVQAAWTDIPHVTHHDRADITELEAARLRYLEHHGEIRLTITALIIKAVAALLERNPRFNSSVDMRSQEVIYKRYIHIGVAVDTERGLLVPVVRDADQKTTAEIAMEIERLAGRARSGELQNAEMDGGTFTITNLGGIGGTSFTPIIRAPEVAILGVSRARPELVRHGDDSDERLLLPLSLSYDHRVINGADAARFTRGLAELLEEPLNLLMEC